MRDVGLPCQAFAEVRYLIVIIEDVFDSSTGCTYGLLNVRITSLSYTSSDQGECPYSAVRESAVVVVPERRRLARTGPLGPFKGQT